MIIATMVGATFRPAEARALVTHTLDVGDLVTLRPDPDNEYDDTAVACYFDDVHIGFLPKEKNVEVFEYLTEGPGEMSAEVVSFQNTLKPVLEIILDHNA